MQTWIQWICFVKPSYIEEWKKKNKEIGKLKTIESERYIVNEKRK